MREILFRAKETFNGECVEGYYEFGYDAETEKPTHYMWVINHSEKYGEMFMVVPETVGEYTGLTDKNGKKIFEGDILKTVKGVGYVVYGKGCFCVQYEGQNKPAIDIVMHYGDVSVIGNTHDSPELLKGE